MAALNPLYDPATDNLPIDPTVQNLLNQPLKDSSGFSPEEQAFLDILKAKVADGTIQLYSPASLLNAAVYDTLTMEARGKADQNAFLMLGKIREILDLLKLSEEPTFQLKNLVASLHAEKTRLEEHQDIFIL